MWRVALAVLPVIWSVFFVQVGAQLVCGGEETFGDVDPVSMMVFSDFQCAYCEQVGPLSQRLKAVYPGPVDVIFKHAPRTNDANLWLVHEAALAAEAQGMFWAFHDSIFASRKPWDRAELDRVAQRMGLDVKSFSMALDDHRYRLRIEADLAEARALWVTGTPAFFVNGIDLVGVGALAEFVEALVSKAEPIRVSKIDLQSAPGVGPVDAPVTLVCFVDLRCGYCAASWVELAELVAGFNGRVRWVFKHFPLAIHPDAPVAHTGALAAGEQGKFWEMATQILNHSGPVQRSDLMRFVRELGLDARRFEADLDRKDFSDRVQVDFEEGRNLGVQGTPTYFVNGERFTGAQPIAVLQSAIQKALNARGLQEDNLWLNLDTEHNQGAVANPSGLLLR